MKRMMTFQTRILAMTPEERFLSRTNILSIEERTELTESTRDLMNASHRKWALKENKSRSDCYLKDAFYEYSNLTFTDFSCPDGRTPVLTEVRFGKSLLYLYIDSRLKVLLHFKAPQINCTSIYPKICCAGKDNYYIHHICILFYDILGRFPMDYSLEQIRDSDSLNLIEKDLITSLCKLDTSLRTHKVMLERPGEKYKLIREEDEKELKLLTTYIKKLMRDDKTVDHINRDFMDCTLMNLRYASDKQQQENKKLNEDTRSKVIRTVFLRVCGMFTQYAKAQHARR